MMLRAFIAVLLGLAALAAGAQQMYRWTDERGRVHISDTPPPPGAKDVQKQRAPGGGAASEGNEPYALQAARKNNPVTLYSAPECDPCSNGRKLLNTRGIPFKEVSVVDNNQIEELKAAVGGNTVPSLVVGTAVKQGYEEGAWHSMLDAAGYPKTGMLPPRAQGEPKPPPEPQAEKPAAQPEPEPTPSGPYSPGRRQGQRPQK